MRVRWHAAAERVAAPVGTAMNDGSIAHGLPSRRLLDVAVAVLGSIDSGTRVLIGSGHRRRGGGGPFREQVREREPD